MKMMGHMKMKKMQKLRKYKWERGKLKKCRS